MAIPSDYFLLYHGVNLKGVSQVGTLLFSKDDLELFPLLALFLSITRKEYEKMVVMETFRTLCETLNVEKPSNITALYSLQYRCIHTIKKNQNPENMIRLRDTFSYLFKERLLAKNNYQKLLSLFEIPKMNTLEEISTMNPFSFQDKKQQLLTLIQKFETLTEKEKSCLEIEAYLDAQKFSVGITGVMNAGKSTMVNALLGAEVLGTSVVPETANLSILKYGEVPKARVFFWNQEEWDTIVHMAVKIEEMKNFVRETEKVFGEGLKNYIQAQSRVVEIEVKNLSSYTSAEHSGKKCNLVKYVELQTPLRFLQEDVEIVDTPGLDDPVIQREEITKSYISRSDMLLHLMNVSQSATQKDIGFIIDALLYQNVSKLIVIITRADTVSRSALDEVIHYTKSAIESELKIQNKNTKLEHILNSITFLPISGKMAFLARTNEEEAKALGFTLEKSGILNLEHILLETLFGKSSQKSQLIISTAIKKLRTVFHKEKETLAYALILSSQSQEEVEQAWEDFALKKQNNKETMTSLSEDMEYHRENLLAYRVSLTHLLNDAFYLLQTVVRERVVSDVRYSYEKTKKKPEDSRIKVIIETAIKDGILDIVREYRYKLSQKCETLYEQMQEQYEGLDLPSLPEYEEERLFTTFVHGDFLTQNNDLLIAEILMAIDENKAKEIQALDVHVERVLKEALNFIERDVSKKLEVLSLSLIEALIPLLQNPIDRLQSSMEEKEKILGKQRTQYNNEGGINHSIAIEIYEKIQALTAIEEELEGVWDDIS